MEIQQTPLKDCFIIKPDVYGDARGIFLETFNEKAFQKATGITTPFVQDNTSHSKRGVLRGLHFQMGEMAQAKLVRSRPRPCFGCGSGPMRKDSPSFGKSFSVILDDVEHLQLYVPRGFAHGFITLSDESIFCYKCDNFYDRDSESGIIYNDATLAIDWHLPEVEFIVSEKDLDLLTFEEAIQ